MEGPAGGAGGRTEGSDAQFQGASGAASMHPAAPASQGAAGEDGGGGAGTAAAPLQRAASMEQLPSPMAKPRAGIVARLSNGILSRLRGARAARQATAAGRASVRAAPPGAPRTERRPPTHLYVLCHGLGGTPRDLNVLRDALGADSNAIVHVAKCNAAPQQDAEAAGEVPKFMQYLRVPLVARTYDGVEAGGQRLADEIREVIARHPQLERISLVGNSLGGIYCRYAAALLYSDDDGTLAGLQADTFLTTASPHLGVGEHGVMGLIPGAILEWVAGLAAVVSLPTIQQLMLCDGGGGGGQSSTPLLVRMTEDAPPGVPDGLQFASALRAFGRRCTFANLVNDVMVPWQTSALRPLPQGPLPWLLPSEHFLPANQDEDWSLSNNVLYERPVPRFEAPAASSARERKASPRLQHMERIAERLTSMEWYEVAVAFPVPLMAHNKICALGRGPVSRALFSDGKLVVQQQARFLLRAGEYAEQADADARRQQ